MKKLVSMMLAVIIAGTLGLTAIAQTTRTGDNARTQAQEQINDKNSNLNQEKHQFKNKTDEWMFHKNDLVGKRIRLMTNKGLNLDLLKENKQLREQIRSAIKEIENSKTTLPEKVVEILKDYKEQLRLLTVQVYEEKGKINDLLKQNKGLIKNKDYEGMVIIYDQIFDIQQVRSELLKQINDVLVKIVEFVEK